MSLDESSESLRIRTANGVEKQVRITQDPGMIFFPTMQVSGIQVGQGEKKFAPLDHYPVISPQSDKNWLVDSINIRNLLSSFTNGGVIVFRLRILMRKSFWENYTPEVNQGGSHIPSATLDYDTGDGYYKTIFEWIFSDGIDNILPQ